MTRIVVDASIVVKWFFPEVYSLEATRYLQQGRELHAPDLIWVEAGNAIWKRWRRGELSHEEAEGIPRDLRRFPIEIHPSELLLEAAYDIASRIGKTMYDSLYAALALRLGRILFTADRSFYEALREDAPKVAAHWIGDPLSI